MEDVVSRGDVLPPKKSSTTLSVDRAAFLLLRVKKAFKKKRQQRKDKQQQHSTNAAEFNAQQSRLSRKVATPLIRSNTLPAIIVPGLPIVSLYTERTQYCLDENVSILNNKATNSHDNRWCLLRRNTTAQPTATFNTTNNTNNTNNSNNNNNVKCTTNINKKTTLSIKSLNLPNEDVIVAYRRKSSGSTPNSNDITKLPANYYQMNNTRCNDNATITNETLNTLERTQSISEEFPYYAADGSVLLNISELISFITNISHYYRQLYHNSVKYNLT